MTPVRPDGGPFAGPGRLAAWVVGVLVLIWLLYSARVVLVAFAFALVVAIVLNAPVTWLVDHGWKRVPAAVLTLLLVLAAAVVLAWLVVPKIGAQVAALAAAAPDYVERLRARANDLLGGALSGGDAAGGVADLVPPLPRLFGVVGGYSLAAGAALAVALVMLAVVMYAVVSPAPLVRLYLRAFPEARQAQAARALARASDMLVRWVASNLVAGSIEAVAAGLFLSWMGVSGALVWAALAFFAELVPKIGLYLMALPPVLVSLADNPMQALWVGLFYLTMSEVMGDLVIPRLLSSAMDIHPVSVLFVMLVAATAFGLPGALMATPLAVIVKAYYETFRLERLPVPVALETQVRDILHRRADPAGDGE